MGVFAIGHDLKTDPYHTEESGSAQWRFSQSSTSPKWSTPGLFEGYGIHTVSTLNTFSGAIFGQLDFALTERRHILGGLRYNYDWKKVDFNRKTYGGLETTDLDLITMKKHYIAIRYLKPIPTTPTYPACLPLIIKQVTS